MTYEQALRWFDNHADNLQRAGVKMRVFHAVKDQSAEVFNGDTAERKAIVEAAWINAVEAEIRGDKLP